MYSDTAAIDYTVGPQQTEGSTGIAPDSGVPPPAGPLYSTAQLAGPAPTASIPFRWSKAIA